MVKSRVHILMENFKPVDKWIEVECPDPPDLSTPVWWSCAELREMYYERFADCDELRTYHWDQVKHLYE
jgi:hypothetical protein